MRITSSLRFLYIFDLSGLLWALRLVNLTSIWAFEVAGTAARWRHCAPPLEHINCRQLLKQCKSFYINFQKLLVVINIKYESHMLARSWLRHLLLVYQSRDNCGVSFPKLLFRALNFFEPCIKSNQS